MQIRRHIEKEMRDMRDMAKETRTMIEEITGKQKMWTQEQTEAKRMQQEKREEHKQQENKGKRSSQGPQAQQWRQQRWQRNQQQQWRQHKWPHHPQLRQNVQHHQVGLATTASAYACAVCATTAARAVEEMNTDCKSKSKRV